MRWHAQHIEKIRRRIPAQAHAEGRALLKGRRFNLLRNPENPTADGRADHEELLAANRGLSLVYALKNPFKQVWTYTYRKRQF